MFRQRKENQTQSDARYIESTVRSLTKTRFTEIQLIYSAIETISSLKATSPSIYILIKIIRDELEAI